MNDYSAALQAKREQLLAQGVLMMDPAAVYVEEEVTVGAGTLLLPGTILRGKTVIGKNCCIGPQTMITDSTVEDGCTVNASQCEESAIEKNCQIGPYTHIRPHCVVGEGSKIGAFVQLKNCNLGRGTKMAHLTYVGDSDVGDNCNFGCGTITCNYDGKKKHATTIGDGAFIGSDTMMVAPVNIGAGAIIGAGSCITKDVAPDALALTRPEQREIPGWAAKKRERQG